MWEIAKLQHGTIKIKTTFRFCIWICFFEFVYLDFLMLSSVFFMLLQPPPAWLATSWCRSLWSPWELASLASLKVCNFLMSLIMKCMKVELNCPSRWSLYLCIWSDHSNKRRLQQCTTESEGWHLASLAPNKILSSRNHLIRETG